MKRTIKPRIERRPAMILMADPHLREDQPICRTDDFCKEQWKKMSFIAFLQQKYDCYVVNAGDLFHHWKPSPYLLSKTIQCLPNKFYTCYGQHDLPQHSLELADKCGVNTLVQAGRIELIKTHFGQEPIAATFIVPGNERKVLVWHKFTWTGKQPWPGCTDPTAEELMDKYPEYDLIVTGDNHKPFVVKKDGRLLVNPGSMMRQTADQADHRPCVYLWYARENRVEPIYLPIEEGVVSREHIDKVTERDERISAFVKRLSDEWDSDVNFEQNLQRFFKENRIRDSVKQIIELALEQ